MLETEADHKPRWVTMEELIYLKRGSCYITVRVIWGGVYARWKWRVSQGGGIVFSDFSLGKGKREKIFDPKYSVLNYRVPYNVCYTDKGKCVVISSVEDDFFCKFKY